MLEKIVFFCLLVCTSFVHCQKLQLRNDGARLMIYPQNVFLNAFAGKPLDLLCVGDTDDEDSLTEFKWLNPRREEIPEGSPGVERVNSNTLLLSFVDPTVKDSGSYKCTAIYSKSDYLEAEVSVLFYENIEFENCPEYQLLYKNEDGEISCHVKSSNESFITWTNGNKKLESSRYTFTSSGIAIENVKKEDSGLYVVEVFEPRTGTLKSRNINIDVSDRDAKDTIGIDELFISQVTESTVKFEIHLSGGAWGIEAEYREKLSERGEPVSWTQGDVFEVQKLIPSGLYQFRFRPRPSTTTKWFKYLDVTLLPEVPKVIYSYKESGNLELEYVWTTADSRRESIDKYRLSYQKIHKAPDGFKRSKCIINVDIQPCFGSKYTITGLANATFYEINVTAHTSAGFGKSASQTIEARTSIINDSRVGPSVLLLSSLVIPAKTYEVKLVRIPSDNHFNAPIGKPLEITCKGDPSDDKQFTDIKWKNPEGQSVSDGNPRVQKAGDASLKLLFTNPKKDDSGTYECTAKYGRDHDLNSKVSILFYGGAPTFGTNYERITAEEGSKKQITCSAMGDKPITYTWYDQHERAINDIMNSTIYTSESENGSTLVIPTVRVTDEGSYVCTASNQHGLSSKVYDIKVKTSSNNDTEDDGAIRYIRTVNVTSTTVQFSISTSDQVSLIEVLYNESRESKEYRKQWKIGDVYIVENLIPAGLYNFRFRAISSDTQVEITWSKSYRVVLLPDAPEVIFRSLGTDIVRFEFFRKFEDILRGTIDKYQVMYYTVHQEGGQTWKPSNCAVTIELPTCLGSGYTLAGLSKNVYYELQVRAHTESGYGNPFKQKIYVS